MTRTILLAITLITLGLPASAQSMFERMEAATVAMNTMMFDAMVAQTPALEGHMPSAEWSDGLRAAYTCMFDGFEAEVGAAAMEPMVADFEAQLETITPEEILAGGADIANPEGLTDARADQIVAGCGMMEAFMTHLSSTGALQILMQDEQ